MSNYSHINPIGGLNPYNNQMEGTNFSSSSLTITEHMMEKSFDDDKRNLFEQVKALLLAKLQIIQRTVKGININKEIESVKAWNFDIISSANTADIQSNNKGYKYSRERRNTMDSAPSLKNLNTVRTHQSGNNLENTNQNMAKKSLLNIQKDNNSCFVVGSFENFELETSSPLQ